MQMSIEKKGVKPDESGIQVPGKCLRSTRHKDNHSTESTTFS